MTRKRLEIVIGTVHFLTFFQQSSMLYISFGAGAASCYGSGCAKMMRFRLRNTGSNTKKSHTVSILYFRSGA
jgi:hypothetical protein